MRRRGSVLVALAVLLGLAGSASAWRLPVAGTAVAAADPIIGDWNQSGGVIRISGGPVSFTGAVVKIPAGARWCAKLGAPEWHITKKGTSYTGTMRWYDANCAAKGSVPATWSIDSSGSELVLTYCFTSPEGTKGCSSVTRPKPVAPPKPTTTTPTTTAPPPTEAGTITGSVTDGHGDPVPLAYIRVTFGSNTKAVITDQRGRYRVTGLPMGKVAGFDPTEDAYRVEAWLQLMLDVKQAPFFRVLYRSQGAKTVRAVTKAFVLTKGLRKDVDFGRTGDLQLNLSAVLPATRLADLAAIYFHTAQAVSGGDRLLSEPMLRPFDVVAFAPGTGACWRGPVTSPKGAWTGCLGLTGKRELVGLSAAYSEYAEWSRPANREWHEYGHQFMADILGERMPSHAGRRNHEGYCVNDRSTDAWTEGFAEFFSIMVAKNVVGAAKFDEYRWGTDPTADNLEVDYQAWNWPEEFAVAGLLLDLVDGRDWYHGPDDDPVQIAPKALIAAIQKGASAEGASNGHIFDMVDLYRNLAALNIGAKDTDKNGRADLNDVFIAHGFFANTDGDETYEPGEAIGFTDHTASVPNGGRPCNTVTPRRGVPDRPGGFIRFKAVEPSGKPVAGVTFKVTISYAAPYTRLSRSDTLAAPVNGRLRLSLPPKSATATIVASAPDHKPSQPFTIDSKTYWQRLSLRNDKPLLDHTFTLVPTRPGTTPTTPAGDTTPPKVQALPSSGSPGTKIALRFTSSDDSGKTRQQITIYRGDTQVAQGKTDLSATVPGKVYSVDWDAPASITGPLRFCVQAWDAAGNASAISCASITLLGS